MTNKEKRQRARAEAFLAAEPAKPQSAKEKRGIGNTLPAPIGVNGGHRAGKRKRGNSLTKVAPNTNTSVTAYDVRNEHGERVATIRTLRYTRKD